MLQLPASDDGVGWVEDPGNRDERFERSRVRKAMAALEAAVAE